MGEGKEEDDKGSNSVVGVRREASVALSALRVLSRLTECDMAGA